MKRRSILAMLTPFPVMGTAAETALPIPDSLQRIANEAGRREEPLVLLISLPGCPHCELVRRNYLIPMRDKGLSAWQLSFNDQVQSVLDFQGRASSGAALAARWKVRVTPSVLLFGTAGTEIADRLEGIAVPDFYGAYLDNALAAGRKRIKSKS